MFWSDILIKISKNGAMNYNDLKGLDVHEFFCVLANIEMQNKAQEER